MSTRQIKNDLLFGILMAFFLLPKFVHSQLLILTPDEFTDELAPLKRFKDSCGRRTVVLSLNQVYVDFSSYADEAEMVKRCIEYYYKNQGMRQVLLVGDVDKFPLRWRWWGLPGQDGWGITDLYYADLFKDGTYTFDDWDGNNNGLYGEIEFGSDGTINNDNIDFLPDVSVGRIPASTEDEVTAYVKKVIMYELKTVPWASWYKKAGLYTGTWESFCNIAKDTVANYLTRQGFTSLTKRYTDWSDPENPQIPAGVPAGIVSDINSGLGFANYLGHGNIWGWACLGFGTAQLTSLTNTNMLPVAFGGACETGMIGYLVPFAQYKDVNGTGHWGTNNGEPLTIGNYPHTSLPRPACIQDGQVVHNSTTYIFDLNCFAESFVFGSPVGQTGAIAYLGARSGAQRFVVDLDKLFFKSYEDGRHRMLGDMWRYMVEEYYDLHNLQDANNWANEPSDWVNGHVFDEPQKLLLFGDPSLMVGGAFTETLSGTVHNSSNGPLLGYHRYRVTGDITVPAGYTLSADSSVSVLFERGRKITAVDASINKGLIIRPGSNMTVHLLSIPPEGNVNQIERGVKITGELKIRNGGEIKVY